MLRVPKELIQYVSFDEGKVVLEKDGTRISPNDLPADLHEIYKKFIAAYEESKKGLADF